MSFGSISFPFNGNRTVQANTQLGIFSAADYSSSYGTGGDDTAAVQAALNSASAAGGGVAFLPPPRSGTINISAQLNLGNNGVWLVGASPTVTVKIVPGSNLDWLVSTAAHNAVDYRTVFSVNHRNITISGNPYTTYDPSTPIKTSTGGGIQNVHFVADTSAVTSLGHCVMLNGAYNFTFGNTAFSNFTGENISLWDCFGTQVQFAPGEGMAHHVGVHRACYETQIFGANSYGATGLPFLVYTEQFQIPSGPLLTLTPEFTKFVDCHHYSNTLLASAFDLQGAVYVNLTSATAENTTALIAQGTRFGAPTYQVLADVSPPAAGVQSLTAGTNITLGGTAQNPIVNATVPPSGVQSVTAADSSITVAGTASNPTVALATPVSVARGGTGTATPTGVVAGAGISVTGTFPNQTVSAGTAGSGIPYPFQFVATNVGGATSQTITFTKPALAGSLLVAAFVWGATVTTPPAGYTLLGAYGGGFATISVYTKVAAGGESSVTCSIAPSNDYGASAFWELSPCTVGQINNNATSNTSTLTSANTASFVIGIVAGTNGSGAGGGVTFGTPFGWTGSAQVPAYVKAEFDYFRGPIQSTFVYPAICAGSSPASGTVVISFH